MTDIELAEAFHSAYERLAPQFGYTTREDTKRFEHNSPNGKLMTAVCSEVLSVIGAQRDNCAGSEPYEEAKNVVARLGWALKSMLAGIPVRDADEILVAADRFLRGGTKEAQ